ncbi:hypothetical protein CEXT_264541 [Caerostris extrusa]|uniref:Uncharacterized protein n=1 Tax=Caerostris extrusa TaxID=172846 RepID=A0AAV4R7T0_CAEEX|nr:hypothetical protein CEXT_264541 [Caerostris extrusa]
MTPETAKERAKKERRLNPTEYSINTESCPSEFRRVAGRGGLGQIRPIVWDNRESASIAFLCLCYGGKRRIDFECNQMMGLFIELKVS